MAASETVTKYLLCEFEFIPAAGSVGGAKVTAQRCRMIQIKAEKNSTVTEDLSLILDQLYALCRADQDLQKRIREQEMILFNRNLAFNVQVLHPTTKQWCRLPSRDPRLQKILAQSQLKVGLEPSTEDDSKASASNHGLNQSLNPSSTRLLKRKIDEQQHRISVEELKKKAARVETDDEAAERKRRRKEAFIKFFMDDDEAKAKKKKEAEEQAKIKPLTPPKALPLPVKATSKWAPIPAVGAPLPKPVISNWAPVISVGSSPEPPAPGTEDDDVVIIEKEEMYDPADPTSDFDDDVQMIDMVAAPEPSDSEDSDDEDKLMMDVEDEVVKEKPKEKAPEPTAPPVIDLETPQQQIPPPQPDSYQRYPYPPPVPAGPIQQQQHPPARRDPRSNPVHGPPPPQVQEQEPPKPPKELKKRQSSITMEPKERKTLSIKDYNLKRGISICKKKPEEKQKPPPVIIQLIKRVLPTKTPTIGSFYSDTLEVAEDSVPVEQADEPEGLAALPMKLGLEGEEEDDDIVISLEDMPPELPIKLDLGDLGVEEEEELNVELKEENIDDTHVEEVINDVAPVEDIQVKPENEQAEVEPVDSEDEVVPGSCILVKEDEEEESKEEPEPDVKAESDKEENNAEEKSKFDIDNDDVGLDTWKEMLGIEKEDGDDDDSDSDADGLCIAEGGCESDGNKEAQNGEEESKEEVEQKKELEEEEGDGEIVEEEEEEEEDRESRRHRRKKHRRKHSSEYDSEASDDYHRRRKRHSEEEEERGVATGDSEDYHERRRSSRKHKKKNRKRSRGSRKHHRRRRESSEEKEEKEDGEIGTEDEEDDDDAYDTEGFPRRSPGATIMLSPPPSFGQQNFSQPPPGFNPSLRPPGHSVNEEPDHDMGFHVQGAFTDGRPPPSMLLQQPPPMPGGSNANWAPPANLNGYQPDVPPPPTKADIVAATLDLTNRPPMTAVYELCARFSWPAPQFILSDSQIVGAARVWKMSVKVNTETFVAENFDSKKDMSKVDAARVCLKKMGVMMET